MRVPSFRALLSSMCVNVWPTTYCSNVFNAFVFICPSVMTFNHKPSCNPSVGVPQYRLAIRQAVKSNGGANFAQLFSVNEGIIKDPKQVTPSHVNRVWKVIEALVDVGCTNLCLNAKPFQEACKFEFNNDQSALGPKPFQIMVCDASDHITSILYLLRAFFRENRVIEETVIERSKNKKTNKFRSMLTPPDHLLLAGLELRVKLDITWTGATFAQLALPSVPFSFSAHAQNEALVACRPNQNAPSRAASRASSFDSCSATELDPTPTKFAAVTGKSLFSGFFGSEEDPNKEDDNPLYNIPKLTLFGPRPEAKENASGQSSSPPCNVMVKL
jgi:hypothetical protein